jgi:hypothetical protein
MKKTKKELQTIASKKEIARVVKKLFDREETKIELSSGEIQIIRKEQGAYFFPNLS